MTLLVNLSLNLQENKKSIQNPIYYMILKQNQIDLKTRQSIERNTDNKTWIDMKKIALYTKEID